MAKVVRRSLDSILRTALACGALSLALHALVLLAPGAVGRPYSMGQRGAPDLQVTFAELSGSSDAVRAALDAPPARLTPGIARIRDYPKLLPFSPVDWAPSFNEKAYRPLSELTVPPATDEEIAIPFPRGVHHLGTLTAVLTLFIDEDGTVANVRADEPRLAESYEHAAIEAFAHARFHPGTIGERAVKSRMTIRVAFDSGDSGKTRLAQLGSAPRKP